MTESIENPKFAAVEKLYNSYIGEIMVSLPEPNHTYLYKVKKWQAIHPKVLDSNFTPPTGITSRINDIRMKLMQLKIGGLKESHGFSSGIKFNIKLVIQALASGRGISSKDRPFIRVTSDISHSITLLVDFSSSMSLYIDQIKESVYIFAEVLNRLQLSFSILGYSEKFWIIKDFSEKWDINSKIRLFNLQPKGMAPDGIAILTAANVTEAMIENGKVMFIISDGLYEDRIFTKRTVQEVRKHGIVPIGISTFADIDDVFPVNIVEDENLNGIWATDALMRIYSREFQSEF